MRKRAATLVVFLVAACASEPPPPKAPPTQAAPAAATAKPSYPKEWFAPLPEGTKAYSWEITPDQAAPGEVILSKRTELGCFSNLAATPFELDGKRFASLEGFWQAMYFPEGSEERAKVEQLSGFEAKKAGDTVKKRVKTEQGVAWMTYGGRRFDPHGSAEDQAFHLALIERATRAKVDQNPDVKRLLLATGDLVLKPDHNQGADATAAYRYFDILMKIRGAIR